MRPIATDVARLFVCWYLKTFDIVIDLEGHSRSSEMAQYSLFHVPYGRHLPFI